MRFFLIILIPILFKSSVNVSNIDYSKCLSPGVYCQSVPENCVQDNIECSTLLTVSHHVKTGLRFELFGKIDKNRHWFAMGLSTNKKMGSDSVTEIYVSNDGKHQEMRQSWNEGIHNQVIGGGVKGIAQVGGIVNKDGILSGSWIRSTVTEVHSNRFDIMNTKYNILLATGPIDANNNKRRHNGLSISKSEVDLQLSNTQALNDLYESCKNTKTTLCFGLPGAECIQSKNCDLALAITKSGYGMSAGTVSFQLIGKTDNADSGWIATALSDDNQMGSDSVVECLLLSNSTALLRNSWNDGSTNIVIGDVPGVVQTGHVTYDNGLLNCKWTRASNTKVKDMIFDLQTKKYFILLAKGSIGDQKMVTKLEHSDKISSKTSVDLGSQQIVTTTSQPISSTPIPSQLNNAYERCHNNTRLCFGIKTGDKKCMDNNDCTLLFSSVPKSGGDVQIEIYFNRGSFSSDNWAAVALSTDQTMGEDSVTECILKDGKVVIQEGWNPSGHNPTTNVNSNSSTTLETSFLDGIVYCKWLRNAHSSIEGHDFDIQNSSFYLLLAHGPLNSEKTIRKHSDVQASSDKVNLQTLGILGTQSLIYIQLHATFMIVGWLGCVATAILLARHYKNSWTDSTLCGVKIWFAFHRSLMICGVVLVLAATIIIFVNKKGWVGSSAHPIVGLTSIILCFLQPIGALFRPNPDSSNRWIFNWLHWSGGYIGYVLSFVAICLSTKFSTLVPKQTLSVLIAYIIVYILSHVLHHLKTILRNRQKEKHDHKNRRETLIDVTLALLNVVIVMAFVLALVILLFI